MSRVLLTAHTAALHSLLVTALAQKTTRSTAFPAIAGCGLQLPAHLAIGVACTPWADAPAHAVVRVAPKQVTHGPLMWDLLKPVQLVNLVQGVHGWRQACSKIGAARRFSRTWVLACSLVQGLHCSEYTQLCCPWAMPQAGGQPVLRKSGGLLTCMRAEELVLDHSRQGEAVKQVCQDLPYPSTAVLAQALLIEAVDLGVIQDSRHMQAFQPGIRLQPGIRSKSHLLPAFTRFQQRACHVHRQSNIEGLLQVQGLTHETLDANSLVTCVICLLSWLPRMMTTRLGQRTFRATTMHTVSTL